MQSFSMSLEEAIEFIDALVYASQGKHLSDLQRAMIQASWPTQRQNYSAIAKAYGYSENYLKYDAGPKLWLLLSQVLQEKVRKTNFQAALERRWKEAASSAADLATGQANPGLESDAPPTLRSFPLPLVKGSPRPQQDWGDAVDVSTFYGRTHELEQLQQWIVGDASGAGEGQRCRLVAVLGMGGMGKTALSVKLAEQVQQDFDYLIWRSLRNAPPLSVLLENMLQILPHPPLEPDSTTTVDGRSQIMLILKRYRCLLVLDNGESILRSGEGTVSDRAGQYRQGYEDYGEFFRQVGETPHASCLVITSREKPKDIALLEGQALPVRSWSISGLQPTDSQKLLQAKGRFIASDADWQELTHRYSGNPLALKIISASIQELFDGSIADFLAQGTAIFGDIRELLQLQFRRLSELEKEILYWLAINREPISLADLRDDMVSSLPQPMLLEALESLKRRSLCIAIRPGPMAGKTAVKAAGAPHGASITFTVQPVVVEFVTHQFIEQIHQELYTQALRLFKTHALMKATAKDYVRQAQIRLIVQPIVQQLLWSLGSRTQVEAHLKQILSWMRSHLPQEPSYGAGNLINLLCQLAVDLRGYDLSQLAIWQADLQGINLHQVNLSGARFKHTVFTKNLGSSLAVSFSPDGETLATSDMNGAIRLWRVADGSQLLACQGHASWVCLVAFSPDSTLLASGSEDHVIKLWDMSTGRCIKILAGHTHWVRSVAFAPSSPAGLSSPLLASGSFDQTVRLWDIRTGQCQQTLIGHTSWVSIVAFSPDGAILASASDDSTIRLWQVSTGRCLRVLQGHTSRIWSAAFSPDGAWLASGSEDHTVKLWDLATGDCLDTLTDHENWVWSVAFSPDGRWLASSSEDETVRLWDSTTRQCHRVLRGHAGWVQSVAFNRDGMTLASGSADQTVKLWNVYTGECMQTLQGYASWVQSVAFSPDGATLASSSEDHTVKLWSMEQIDQAAQRKEQGAIAPISPVPLTPYPQAFRGHTSALLTVAFSPDGQILATGSFDQTVCLWERQTGRCLHVLSGHRRWIRSIAFSPSGQHLASSSGDCTLRLWDVQSGTCLSVITGHDQWVWSVAFSPDGRTLASSSDDQTIRLWDVATGTCQGILRQHTSGVTSVAFSPDGRTLASSSADQTIRLWDLDSGTCVHTLQGHCSAVWLTAFSPDGMTLASSSADQTVRLWSARTGDCLGTLQGHSNLVFSVAFSPDGRTLASGSRDETIRLWDVATQTCWQTLRAERPYEGMQIMGITGITDDQQASLVALGAIATA